MDNLIFIQASPCDVYFLWQTIVQIKNFSKFGLTDKMHILVWYPKDRIGELEGWKELGEKHPEVKIFFYEDNNVNLGLYIPLIRPFVLKQYFKQHQEELKDKVFFYHDSDIIFRELPDFETLLQDNICWQSDTSGYLDYNYLRSKEQQGKIPEEEAIQKLAAIGGIDVATIKSYTGKTGGAQYIFKNIDYTFWEDVERMCAKIRLTFSYDIINSVNRTYFSSENEGFQSWCADMWAVNFSLWKRGLVTDITSELDFSWATDTAETYQRKKIYHNAGASHNNDNIFYKGDYINTTPFCKPLPYKPSSASYYYVKAIQEAQSC